MQAKTAINDFNEAFGLDLDTHASL